MAMLNNEDFLASLRNSREERLRAAETCGPVYQGRKNQTPLVWYDQTFFVNKAPAATMESVYPLRVGGTQNQIDVVLVANHHNENDVTVPANTVFKVELLQSDTADGTFTAYGWEHSVKAPEAMTFAHDRCVWRLAIGNTEKPWVKVKLTVSGGTVSGGNLDLGLAFLPR